MTRTPQQGGNTQRIMLIRGSAPAAGIEVRLGDSEEILRADADGIVVVPEGALANRVLHVRTQSGWIVRKVHTDGGSGLLIVDVSRNEQDLLQRVDLGERYRFERVVGRGGMGVVVEAHDQLLDRRVAVKMLSADLEANQEAQEVFLVEGRSLARLSHPNLVAVHDVAMVQEKTIMVLEFVEGTTAEQALQERPLTVEEVIVVGTQAAAALAHMHEQGLLHRDVKPSNLMIRPDGSVKMIDFGLARSIERLAAKGTRVRGTPAYMAPEQFLGRELTPATDVYQFGATLFELLVGDVPFERNVVMTAELLEVAAPLVSELRPEAPAELAALIERCLRHDPSERPPTAVEVWEVLHAIDVRSGSDSRPPGAPTSTHSGPQAILDPPSPPKAGSSSVWIGGLAVLALILAVGAFYAISRTETAAPPAPEISATATEVEPAPGAASSAPPVAAHTPPLAPVPGLRVAQAQLGVAKGMFAAEVAVARASGDPAPERSARRKARRRPAPAPAPRPSIDHAPEDGTSDVDERPTPPTVESSSAQQAVVEAGSTAPPEPVAPEPIVPILPVEAAPPAPEVADQRPGRNSPPPAPPAKTTQSALPSSSSFATQPADEEDEDDEDGKKKQKKKKRKPEDAAPVGF